MGIFCTIAHVPHNHAKSFRFEKIIFHFCKCGWISRLLYINVLHWINYIKWTFRMNVQCPMSHRVFANPKLLILSERNYCCRTKSMLLGNIEEFSFPSQSKFFRILNIPFVRPGFVIFHCLSNCWLWFKVHCILALNAKTIGFVILVVSKPIPSILYGV